MGSISATELRVSSRKMGNDFQKDPSLASRDDVAFLFRFRNIENTHARGTHMSKDVLVGK